MTRSPLKSPEGRSAMSHKSLMLLTAAALTLMLTTTTTSAARHHAALAMSAIYHMALNQNGWVDDPEAARQKAIWFVRRAVRHAGTDPRDARSSRMGPRVRGRRYRCRDSPYGSIVTYQSELRRKHGDGAGG